MIKKIMVLLAVLFSFVKISSAQITNGQVTLSWLYPSNQIQMYEANGWDLEFNIRGTNNLGAPKQTWPILLTLNYSNCFNGFYDGTNYGFSTVFAIVPTGQFFFAPSSSNFWGESLIANFSSVPPVAIPLYTQISNSTPAQVQSGTAQIQAQQSKVTTVTPPVNIMPK